MALSIAPVDNQFEPVVVRGRVVEWLDGDAAWEIIDQLATKYTDMPLPPRARARRGRDRARAADRRRRLSSPESIPRRARRRRASTQAAAGQWGCDRQGRIAQYEPGRTSRAGRPACRTRRARWHHRAR